MAQETTKIISVAGFRCDKNHSLTKDSYEDSSKVAEEVQRLLDKKGADIILIRVVSTIPISGVPCTNHNKDFDPTEQPKLAEIEEEDKPVLESQLVTLGNAIQDHPQGENIKNQYLKDLNKEKVRDLTRKECFELIIVKLHIEKDSGGNQQ